MKKQVKSLLSRVVASALVVGSMFTGVCVNAAETETTKPTVWVVGDSTACHYTELDDVYYYYKRVGFGDKLEDYLTGVTVENLALSGRSSKSFATGINENGNTDTAAVENYAKLKSGIKAGDTLIIAWGHNDEKTDAYRYTDPNGDKDTAGSFKNSLYTNYIKVAQDAGAEAILCTPIIRRTASEDGSWSNDNLHITAAGNYITPIVELGSELNIPVINSFENTKALYEQVGVGSGPKDTRNGAAETAAATGSAAFHAATQNLKTDNTHLNSYGASMVAYMMARDIAASSASLAANVKADIAAPDATTGIAAAMNADWIPFDESIWENPNIWKLSSPWEAIAMGEGVGDYTEDSHENHDAIQLSDNSFRLKQLNKKGKFSSTGDGMMIAFQQIGANDNFTITATATINDVGAANKNNPKENQVAFGLMCRDNVFFGSTGTLADFVAAGDLQQSGGEVSAAPFARIGGALDTSSKLNAGSTYKDETGATKTWGNVDGTGKVTSDDAALALQYVLDPAAAKASATGFDTTVANVSKGDATDANITAQDSAAILQKSLDSTYIYPFEETPRVGTTVELKLSRKDGVYTAQYGDHDPVTYTGANLAAKNVDHDFVGMFVTRDIDVTFTNVSLTVG